MNYHFLRNLSLKTALIFMIFGLQFAFSRNDSIAKPKSAFWQKVQFGGGLGLGFGNGFTNVSLSPTGYYNINQKYTVGVGLTGSYIAQNANNFNSLGYKSTILGGSVIGIANVLEIAQFSAELEQLNVSTKFDSRNVRSENFWNTALFLGAGYRNQNFTMGIRYNVLFRESSAVYSQAWMPFVRVIF